MTETTDSASPKYALVTHYRAEQLRREMRKVDKAIDKLRKAFRKLGKP